MWIWHHASHPSSQWMSGCHPRDHQAIDLLSGHHRPASWFRFRRGRCLLLNCIFKQNNGWWHGNDLEDCTIKVYQVAVFEKYKCNYVSIYIYTHKLSIWIWTISSWRWNQSAWRNGDDDLSNKTKAPCKKQGEINTFVVILVLDAQKKPKCAYVSQVAAIAFHLISTLPHFCWTPWINYFFITMPDFPTVPTTHNCNSMGSSNSTATHNWSPPGLRFQLTSWILKTVAMNINYW